MSKLLVVLAVFGMTGCGALSSIDVCEAMDMVRWGHIGSSAVSHVVCNKLDGEAKKRCLKERDLAIKAMDIILQNGASSSKKCEIR